ncbi:hypothetical protein Cni_G11569 [Canna indica]|uniref:Uncharacterized protein n=1 Tax=Canna indica TaxID=4628 RepID=A0AAQ3QBV5_9LILI|nr:hypothetical protein Cni_G11569 [Canna indica]
MKRTRAEGALPPPKAAADEAAAPAKTQRRHKATSTPRSTAAAGRTKPAENAARKGRGDDKISPSAAAAAAANPADSLHSPLASLPCATSDQAEVGLGWGADVAAELGEWWWWCPSGVEEEKLSGWFPFVDEDFLCSDTRAGEASSGGLLWEEADHDIWQLQHIHEIPQTASSK